MKPIIGILANTKTTSTVNEEIHLNCSYINAIEKGGAIPIIIPILARNFFQAFPLFTVIIKREPHIRGINVTSIVIPIPPTKAFK
jgi:gamma-glutamyl-gamma-aminobutyrate hydrolase PuuD